MQLVNVESASVVVVVVVVVAIVAIDETVIDEVSLSAGALFTIDFRKRRTDERRFSSLLALFSSVSFDSTDTVDLSTVTTTDAAETLTSGPNELATEPYELGGESFSLLSRLISTNSICFLGLILL